jgi:putative transcriptional regulator
MPAKKAFCARRYVAAALLVMLLLPGMPGMSQAASAAGPTVKPAAPSHQAPASSLTAILLVAQGVVADPNFGGSIVVVMNNIGPAPVGIIINRPMPLTVARFFPKLKRLAQVQDKVYFGGPVEFGTDSVWYLFRAETAPTGAIRVCDGVYVSSDQKLLLQLLSRPNPMQGLRIFVGHAGWFPGQLQAEIEGGAWTPRPAAADAIFNPEPQLPWPAPRGPKRGT